MSFFPSCYQFRSGIRCCLTVEDVFGYHKDKTKKSSESIFPSSSFLFHPYPSSCFELFPRFAFTFFLFFLFLPLCQLPVVAFFSPVSLMTFEYANKPSFSRNENLMTAWERSLFSREEKLLIHSIVAKCGKRNLFFFYL